MQEQSVGWERWISLCMSSEEQATQRFLCRVVRTGVSKWTNGGESPIWKFRALTSPPLCSKFYLISVDNYESEGHMETFSTATETFTTFGFQVNYCKRSWFLLRLDGKAVCWVMEWWKVAHRKLSELSFWSAATDSRLETLPECSAVFKLTSSREEYHTV